ncbi:MAG: polysaccharide biosynthesis protein [Chloroflexi bacterium]|nr:polysaccharide biosynthesis protein [Chloroflexota bacterium]MBU1662185.1 polysaccharide biosynthesis protein [Chloroflexota bacterium]
MDDNLQKIGATIHGVRVLGALEEIPALVDEYHIQEVIIAMPTASGSIIRKVVRACDAAGVSSKILPGVYELLSGDVSVKRLRDVDISDLLRRDSVLVDSAKVEQLLSGKRVMVTASSRISYGSAGGSIGSELCTQIIKCQPAQLIVVGHGENSLYTLASHLARHGFDPDHLQVVVADLRLPSLSLRATDFVAWQSPP